MKYQENASEYRPSAFTTTNTIRDFLSVRLDRAPEVIHTAYSASQVAAHRVYRAIQAGECSMALARGVNVIIGVNDSFDIAKARFLRDVE
ncbi:BcPKS16- polyketide synthase [Apiospora rasikravindrae]|uniref:BcPKS16- polyketide synthase n=1 Tax=Apiospora rasikravindrae TaxID=990691 RepID=A0ABR1SPM4_9PEZI